MTKSEGYKLIEKIQNFGSEKIQLFFDEINTLFKELQVNDKSKTFICTLTNNVNELGIILCSRKVFKLEKKQGDIFIKLVVQNDELEKINFEYIKDYEYYNSSTFIKVKFDDYFRHKDVLYPLLINSLKLDKCDKTQYLSSHSELLFKVITKEKERAFVYDCIDINLKDWKTYLINLSQQPHFQNIVKETEFYLEKGRQAYKDAKAEFENYGIDNLPVLATKIDNEFDKLEGSGKTLQLLDLLNENEKKLIEKINIFYAYVDDKALNKKELNKYIDTRVMAKTNYAQKQFIVDWLRYVSDSSIRDKQITLKRILNFYEVPENNLSMVSEGHRQNINTHLFDNKLTISDKDDKTFIDEFSFLNLNLVNEDNKGFIITRLLYDPKFKYAFWLHSKNYKMRTSSIKELIIAINQKQLEEDFKDFNINFKPPERNSKTIIYTQFSEANSIQKVDLGCHYEIYVDKDIIYLDIHFESKIEGENEKYYSSLKDTFPFRNVDWFTWHKSKWGGRKASKSLRHSNTFKYTDENLIDNIYNSLKDLVEAGKLVAEVEKNVDSWVWQDISINYPKTNFEDPKRGYLQKNFRGELNIPDYVNSVDVIYNNVRYRDASLYNDGKGRLNLKTENIRQFIKNNPNLLDGEEIILKIGYLKQNNTVMGDYKNQPLNQILFGPPGTGKTYKTKELAVSIIDGETPNSRPELSARYDELIESKQIQFTTFHQSMSYEDFVEGLKPILTKEDEKIDVGDIGYEIKNGIFKDMCLNAESFKEYSASTNQFNLKENDFEDKNIFKISLGNTLKATGNKVYEYCRDNQYITLGWGGDIDYSDVTNKKEIINKYTDNTGLIPSSSDFNIRAINHFKLNMQIGDLVFVSHGNKLLKAVGKIVGEYEYNKDPLKGYYHYRKVEWFFTDIKIPVTKVYEKEFSQQSIYEMQTDKINIPFLTESEAIKKSENSNNVVLIIDEINRGNVSAIFGELITLIEEDKRKGKDEEIEVILPYSKEPFTVPDNLYIIGTMNTADRSVEALDSALRRRFSFEEVAPNPEVLQEDTVEHKGIVDDIDLVKLLQAINNRIELLLDKDHKIGHSYFFKLKGLNDLKRVFKDKIIPLLEEYFYGDFGKIGLILGSDFVKKTEKEISFVSDFTDKYEDSEMLKERLIYTITSDTNWSKESFQNIYSKKSE